MLSEANVDKAVPSKTGRKKKNSKATVGSSVSPPDIEHERRSKNRNDISINIDNPKKPSKLRKEKNTLSERKAVNSSSDSDFATPIPKHLKKKRKKDEVGKCKVKKKADKISIIDNTKQLPNTINLRTSPKVLYTAMHNLSTDHKQYVSSIGLGHLLNMKVDGSPTKIGYYAVRNFDPERMVLWLKKGDIKISKELIADLLGLPLCTISIDSFPFRPQYDDTHDPFHNQFSHEPDIRPNGVRKVILQSTEANLMFKVNLFVLICNTFGKTKSMGTCELSMLSKVTKDLDLSNIDWSSYVYDCLKDTRYSWNEYSHTCYYSGPIIFLTLLYVENVQCDSVVVERGKPAICFWNVDAMRRREEAESRSVGFGMGELQEPFIQTNQNERDDNAENDKDEEREDDDTVDAAQHDNAELCIHTIAKMYEKLLVSKKMLDDVITKSIQKFPENRILDYWKEKVEALFQKEEENHGDANDFPTTQWWKENEQQIEHSLMLATMHYSDTVITPLPRYKVVMSNELSDMRNESAKKVAYESPAQEIPSPLPLDVYDSKADQNVGNQRLKRNITKPSCL